MSISTSQKFWAIIALIFLFESCTTNIREPGFEQSNDPVITWNPETGHGEWADCRAEIEAHPCNFEFKDQDSISWELYDHYGSIIILDFSTMWCSVCQYAATKVESIQSRYKGKRVIWVSILVQDLYGNPVTPQGAQAWADTFNIVNSPVLAGDDSIANPSVEGSFSIKSLPTIVIIDRKMVIKYRLDSWNETRMYSYLDEMLDAEEASPVHQTIVHE